MKVISGVFFIAWNNTFRTIKKEHKSIWYVNFKIWSEANIWRYMHSYCNEKDTTIIMIHFFLKPYEVENSILWIPLEWVTHIWPSFAPNHAMHSAHTIAVMPIVLRLDGNSEHITHAWGKIHNFENKLKFASSADLNKRLKQIISYHIM